MALAIAPLAWVLHLSVGYIVIATWCTEGWNGMGIAIAILTLVCLLGAAASGVLGVRSWRRGRADLLTDEEPGVSESWDARMGERGARTVFLAVVAVFMAALFAYLILLQGIPVMITPPCPQGTVP